MPPVTRAADMNFDPMTHFRRKHRQVVGGRSCQKRTSREVYPQFPMTEKEDRIYLPAEEVHFDG